MARTPNKSITTKSTKSDSPEQRRLWLIYPPKLIREPLIWKLGHKFPVVTNIRQESRCQGGHQMAGEARGERGAGGDQCDRELTASNIQISNTKSQKNSQTQLPNLRFS